MTDPQPLSTPATWWRRPSVLALLITVGLLGSALAWPLLQAWSGGPERSVPVQGLPWQVTADGAGGSEVFGLALGQATLADVEARWGHDLVVALIAAPGQAPALEAFVEGFQAAFVTGKLVVAFDADLAWVVRARDRSTRSEIGEGAVRKHELAPDDRGDARRLRVAALSFVPSARLDEAAVLQRFGPAAERITGPDGELHLLFPDRGVAVVLPPATGDMVKARSLIQYVAPAQFEERLALPLRKR